MDFVQGKFGKIWKVVIKSWTHLWPGRCGVGRMNWWIFRSGLSSPFHKWTSWLTKTRVSVLLPVLPSQPRTRKRTPFHPMTARRSVDIWSCPYTMSDTESVRSVLSAQTGSKSRITLCTIQEPLTVDAGDGSSDLLHCKLIVHSWAMAFL